jgi:ferredoxin-NADP reductase
VPSTDATSQTARVRSLTRQSSDTITISLATYFPYRPGQSIQIQLPGDSKKRYYSLSSSPTEGEQVAVTIKVDPAHALHPILSNLKEGDEVQLQGPLGKFGLSDPMPSQAIFIAGGSGVTPFRSMVKFLLDKGVPGSFWLFHSVKAAPDLLFKEEFMAWAQGHPAFHYVPTVTREPGADWTLDTGRIGESLLKKHLTSWDGHFFLCGPSVFVSEMEMLLTGPFHVPASSVRREQW